MTQPDPRKIVADILIELVSAADAVQGAPDEAADRVLAALRDAGWRPPQDLTVEALDEAELDVELAQGDADRLADEIPSLLDQLAEAITERDRLRAQLEAVREAVQRVIAGVVASAHLLDVPFTNAPDQSPWTRIKATLNAAKRALSDAQPKATGGVIEPGLLTVGEDPPASVSYPSPLTLVWPDEPGHITVDVDPDAPHQRVERIAAEELPSPCTCDCHREESSDG